MHTPSIRLGSVRFTMAEFRFLGGFIGNGLVIYTAEADSDGVSASAPELGQMLSEFTRKMFQAPWEMVLAATAGILQTFGLTLLSDGLCRYQANH